MKTAAAPAVKPYELAGKIMATSVKVTLSDGTSLVAEGGHAADVYNWLMDCERYCSSHPGSICPYLGPTLVRVDASGKPIPVTQVKMR